MALWPTVLPTVSPSSAHCITHGLTVFGPLYYPRSHRLRPTVLPTVSPSSSSKHIYVWTCESGFRLEKFCGFLPHIAFIYISRLFGRPSSFMLSYGICFVIFFPNIVTTCLAYFNLYNYVQLKFLTF